MDIGTIIKAAKDGTPIGIVGDILIRSLGLSGVGLSVAAGVWLHRLIPHGDLAHPTSGQYALAVIMFVAASLGCGLLVLGRHIGDRIEVAERWRRYW